MIVLSPRNRLLPLAFISAAALSACGGGASSPAAGVTGKAAKGPLAEATIEAYAIDAGGLPTGEVLATTTTSADGSFSFAQRPAEGPLLLISSGGRYVDEGDPESDPQLRRQIQLAEGQGLRALLPAEQSALALTPFSQMVYQRAVREAAGTNFASVFAASQSQASDALGFDPVAVLPTDPIAPDPTASDAEVAYALALGGFATYLNSISISLGSLPTYPILDAVLFDFSDGQLDSLENGETAVIVGEAGPALPTGFDLNDAIRRFRNNNFNVFPDATLVQVDTETLGGELQPSNNNPVAANDTVNVETGSAGINIDVLANDSDADGDTLVIESLGPTTAGGTASIASTGGVDYTPPQDFVGAEQFTYTIVDGNGGSDTATVTVNVTSPSNTPPVANDDSATTNQDTPLTGIAVLDNDSDADGDTLTIISASASAANGGSVSISGSGTTLDYSPATGFSGTDTVDYTISDGAAQASATLTMTVNAVNQPPTAANDAATTPEDTAVSIEVLGNDTDSDGTLDATSVVIETVPNSGTALAQSDGTVTYTPAPNASGTVTFTYSVADDQGLRSAPAQVTVNVTPVNDPPTALDDSGTLDEDSSINIEVLANDSDPDDGLDTSSVQIVSGPQQGVTTVESNGTVSYAPDANANGSDSFTYSVADLAGLRSSATVSLTINPVNDAPVISGTPQLVTETGNNYNFIPTASDIDGDPLVFSITNQPAWASFDTANGTLSGTPAESDAGTYENIVISVDDGAGGTAALPAFTLEVQLRSAETSFNTAFIELNYAAGAEDGQFGLFSVFQDFGFYDIQPPVDGVSTVTFGPFSSLNEGEIVAQPQSYFLNHFPPEVDPAETQSMQVNASGVLSLFAPYVEELDSGQQTFERETAFGLYIRPSTPDMYVLGVSERDEVFDAADSDEDGTLDYLNANRKREDGASFALELALRQSEAFEVSRLEGDYGFVGLGILMEAGPVESTAFIVEQRIANDGSTTGDDRFAAETMRYDPFASPVTQISSEDGPDPAFVTQYSANANGTVSAEFTDGGAPAGSATGLASPDGSILVLQESILTGDSVEPTSIEQFIQIGLRRTAAAPVVSGQQFRVDALAMERQASDQESYGYLLRSATLNFGTDNSCQLSFREGLSLFIAGRRDDTAAFSDLPGVEGPVETMACTYSTDVGGRLLIDFAGDATDPSSTLFEGFVSETGEVLALRGHRDEPGAFHQRWLMLGALDQGYTGLDNRQPAISITADAASVPAGGSINLTATATDPDSQNVDIRWIASAGSFTTQTGGATTWIAPSVGSGTTLLTAEASDGDRIAIDDVVVSWGLSELPRTRAAVQYNLAQSIESGLVDPSDIIHGWFGFTPLQVFESDLPTCSTGSVSSNFDDADASGTITAGDTATIVFSNCEILDQEPIIDAIYDGTLRFDIEVADQSVEHLPNVEPGTATGNERNYQWRITGIDYTESEDGCTSTQNLSGQLASYAVGETGEFYSIEDGGVEQTASTLCEDQSSTQTRVLVPFRLAVQIDFDAGQHTVETSYRLQVEDGDGFRIVDSEYETDPGTAVTGPLDTFALSSQAKPEDPTAGVTHYVNHLDGVSARIDSNPASIDIAVDEDGNGQEDSTFESHWDWLDTMRIIFPVGLTGDQEVPPVSTAGNGFGFVVLHLHDSGNLLIDVDVFVSNMVPTAAHLHEAPFGQNGDVVFPLSPAPEDANRYLLSGASVTQTQIDTILAGGWYLNVHSDAHPGGEIRGQLTDGEGDDLGVQDKDSDGVSDSDEVNVYGTDPNNPDSDFDGISDGDELFGTGTDPNNPDSDGDGAGDGLEVSVGSRADIANIVRYVSSTRGAPGNNGQSWAEAFEGHLDVETDNENGRDSSTPVFYLYESGQYVGTFTLGSSNTSRSFIVVAGGLGPDDYVPDTSTVFTSFHEGSTAVIDNATDITLTGIKFTDGLATQGGGLDIGPTAMSTVVLDSVEVVGNQAQFGGGIHVASGSTVTVTVSDIHNNQAIAFDGVARGGGIAVSDGAVNVEYSTIRGNQVDGGFSTGAVSEGGGLYAAPATPTINTTTLSVLGSVIANNRTGDAGFGTDLGGGLFASNAEIIEIFDSEILSNRAGSQGGGLYLADSTSANFVTNNLIVGNASVNQPGGGLFVSRASTGQTQIANNTVALNQVLLTEGAGGVQSTSETTGLELRDNIFWLNDDSDLAANAGSQNYAGPTTDSGDFTTGHLIEYNNIEDVLTTGTPIGSNDLVTSVGGNAALANPDFLGSFYLSEGSTSIDFDTTRTASDFDLGGSTTRFDGAVDEGALDLGYHVFFGQGSQTPDAANPESTMLTCNQDGSEQREVVFRPTLFGGETGSGHAFVVGVSSPDGVGVQGRTALDPLSDGNSTYAIDLGDGRYAVEVFSELTSGSFTVSLSFGLAQEAVEDFVVNYDYSGCGGGQTR